MRTRGNLHAPDSLATALSGPQLQASATSDPTTPEDSELPQRRSLRTCPTEAFRLAVGEGTGPLAIQIVKEQTKGKENVGKVSDYLQWKTRVLSDKRPYGNS